MPYKDKALQRETTKNRVRRYRALHKGVTGSNKTDLEAKLEKVGLNTVGNRVSLAPQSMRSPLKEESNSRLPLYNKAIHKTGDRVRMVGPTGKLIEMTVPELDKEGNVMPEY